MKTQKEQKKKVMSWHWNQPEGGMSIEECERIAEEVWTEALLYPQSTRFAILFR